MINRKVASWAILIAAVTFAIAVACSFSHGSTTGYRSIPEPVEAINQIAVMHGNVIDGKIIGSEENMFTNVRFQPYGTALLYDESVLFCGNVADEFFRGPIEVRFEARSHRMFEGIGCHNLMSVTKWVPPQQKGW